MTEEEDNGQKEKKSMYVSKDGKVPGLTMDDPKTPPSLPFPHDRQPSYSLKIRHRATGKKLHIPASASTETHARASGRRSVPLPSWHPKC